MYKLAKHLLINYAKVMVHYALNNGEGIKKGETVLLYGNECSKDLFMAIYEEIISAGANVIIQYFPDNFDRYGLNQYMLEFGTNKQLNFFPKAYYNGILSSIQHHLIILSNSGSETLKGIPPERRTQMATKAKLFYKMRTVKENKGKLSWAVCFYGTPAAASVVGLTIEEYWKEIIKACYLDDKDPVGKWKKTQSEIGAFKNRLNTLNIQHLHIEGPDVDLQITIGEKRKWLTGGGKNIPSFEIYTSPDWRGTNGWIRFNQPLYYLGSYIPDIELHFKNGIVSQINASENVDALCSMIGEPNANKIGEISFTDCRHSNITKPMGITLFDENIGGVNGNTHIALGNAYEEAYSGNINELTVDLKNELGFNICPAVHTDIISTSNREVTATLVNGDKLLIYNAGRFLI